MNCCDDNGQCTQGHNCPIRATKYPAEQPAEPPIAHIHFWTVVLFVGFIAVWGFFILLGMSGWVDFLLPTK